MNIIQSIEYKDTVQEALDWANEDEHMFLMSIIPWGNNKFLCLYIYIEEKL